MSYFDCIVVGAGIMGSATALELIHRGCKVLLLEQFPLPHSRGSSHGHTRQIRYLYDDETYLKLLPDSYAGWSKLEQAENVQLFLQTGALMIGPTNNQQINRYKTTLLNSKWANHCKIIANVEKEFPQLRFPSGHYAILDEKAGLLFADKALNAYWVQIRKRGGTIIDGARVVKINPGPTIRLWTSNGKEFSCQKLVLCCGPWSHKVLAMTGLRIPLEPRTVYYYFLKVTKEGIYAAKNGFPTTNMIDEQDDYYYAWPSHEYEDMIKCGWHTGPICDPDQRDQADSSEHLCKVLTFFANSWPHVDPKVCIREACMYTTTPDEHFVMDKHPLFPNIAIGGGFSGHGFKFAPVVGRILSDLVLNGSTSYAIAPFSIGRFREAQLRKSKL